MCNDFPLQVRIQLNLFWCTHWVSLSLFVCHSVHTDKALGTRKGRCQKRERKITTIKCVCVSLADLMLKPNNRNEANSTVVELVVDIATTHLFLFVSTGHLSINFHVMSNEMTQSPLFSHTIVCSYLEPPHIRKYVHDNYSSTSYTTGVIIRAIVDNSSSSSSTKL